jgi:ABC-type nitrate/sulfonate/bicarbonate transport system substrate-binding protein
MTRLCALLMVSMLLSPGWAAAQQRVRVAMLAPNALLWSHAVAVAKGFYTQNGIVVSELRTSSSPSLLQAVSTGSAEAGVSLGDLAIRAIDLGAPITIAGAIMDRTTLRLVGGQGITSFKQLEGQPVTAGAVEGGTANQMRYQLLQKGVDPRGVKMVSINASTDRLVALGNGQVKAALLTAPFDRLAVEKGMVILDVYKEPYLLTPLLVNTDWAKRSPATVTKLVHALRDAADWIYTPENRQAAIDILAHYTNTDPAVCADAYDFLIVEQHALSRTMDVSLESLENIVKIDRAVGASPSTDRPVILSHYFDPEFLR